MATWFRFPKALIGVSNKAGSSTLRRMASGKYKEYSPNDARIHAIKENVPSFLVLRDPVERAESAFNYFSGLGWPRMSGVGYRTLDDFYRHLTATAVPKDPHWAPQKTQHEVGGKQWWDYELPFDVACRDLFQGHENPTRGGITQRFTLEQRIELELGVYHLDLALPPKRLEYLSRDLVF